MSISYKYYKPKREVKSCLVCGTEFFAKTNGKLCSTECKRRNRINFSTEWRLKYPGRRNATMELYYKNNIEKQMLMRAVRRSRETGVNCDLDISDIIVPDICPVFKVPMIRKTRYAASLDKINPKLGYVKGNVQVISKLANVMKQDSSKEELRLFAEWVISQS